MRRLDLWVTLPLRWKLNQVNNATEALGAFHYQAALLSQRFQQTASLRCRWGVALSFSNRGVQQQKTETKFITWLMSLFRVNLTTLVTKLLLFFYFYSNSKLIAITTQCFVSNVFGFTKCKFHTDIFAHHSHWEKQKTVQQTLHPQKTHKKHFPLVSELTCSYNGTSLLLYHKEHKKCK